MRFSPIAVAVAAALLSFGAVAQEKKEESKAGSTMSQEQKPSTPAAGGASASTEKKEGSAAGGASASTEKKEGSAAAGASAPTEKKAEGSAAAGASAGGKAKGQAAAGSGQDPEVVKQVQTKLNEQGHDVGAVDGVIGPKTQKGLKEFQTSKGIKATGQLDQQTLSALGVSGSAAGGASAKPEKKAEGAPPAAEKKPEKAEGSAAAGGTKPEEKKPDSPATPGTTEKPKQ
jgi:peptidoglycan hydrolase-like protein with peptidoglycan-binding domain